MRAYTKIVVEQQSANHWTAWLDGYPQLSAGGELPAQHKPYLTASCRRIGHIDRGRVGSGLHEKLIFTGD